MVVCCVNVVCVELMDILCDMCVDVKCLLCMGILLKFGMSWWMIVELEMFDVIVVGECGWIVCWYYLWEVVGELVECELFLVCVLVCVGVVCGIVEWNGDGDWVVVGVKVDL